jgi:hypothetical protein
MPCYDRKQAAVGCCTGVLRSGMQRQLEHAGLHRCSIGATQQGRDGCLKAA